MHSITRQISAPKISGRAESRLIAYLWSRTIARDYSATRRNLETRVLKVIEIIRVYPIPLANYDLEIVRRRDGGRARLRCRPRPPLARRQAIFTCVRVIFNEHAERPLRNAERRRQFLVLFLFLLANSLFCSRVAGASVQQHLTASIPWAEPSRRCGLLLPLPHTLHPVLVLACRFFLLVYNISRNNPMRLRPIRCANAVRCSIIIGHVFAISSRGVSWSSYGSCFSLFRRSPCNHPLIFTVNARYAFPPGSVTDIT